MPVMNRVMIANLVLSWSDLVSVLVMIANLVLSWSDLVSVLGKHRESLASLKFSSAFSRAPLPLEDNSSTDPS